MPLIPDSALDDLKQRNPCDAIAAKWVRLRRSGGKLIGPCPICSRDRMSKDAGRFKVDADGWVCAVCQDGGDVIRLVGAVEGKSFLEAVEWLGGAQQPDPARERELARQREAKREENERSAAQYRERERERVWTVWRHGRAITGTVAERYLAGRGLTPPVDARLRFHATMRYAHGELYDDAGRRITRVLWEGPGMLAAIVGPDGHFAGLHTTYLDPATGGKLVIADPDTGEVLPAKKVRGSKKGGFIHLGGDGGTARTLFMGEGIETVLSVRQALAREGRDLSRDLFWSSVDLGNLGGRSSFTVAHPTATTTDIRGHKRQARVPGPVPDMDEPSIPIPAGIREIILLGDGDSDRFATEQTLLRAAARYGRPDRIVRVAWAAPGKDFNDMWREMAA